MTVFLSWAHEGHHWPPDRADHPVITFGCLLDNYVDVEADFFRYTEPGMDWTRYGPRSVKEADTVLIVSSDAYWERWEGRNPTNSGAGTARETDALLGLFDRDQQAFQLKVVIVVLPGQDERSIPDELSRVQRFRVPGITPRGIEPLLRRLLNVPRYRKCERKIPWLPARRVS
jgi:SEFIR domain